MGQHETLPRGYALQYCWVYSHCHICKLCTVTFSSCDTPRELLCVHSPPAPADSCSDSISQLVLLACGMLVVLGSRRWSYTCMCFREPGQRPLSEVGLCQCFLDGNLRLHTIIRLDTCAPAGRPPSSFLMQSLLSDPNPNSPANSEAARLFNENR